MLEPESAGTSTCETQSYSEEGQLGFLELILTTGLDPSFLVASFSVRLQPSTRQGYPRKKHSIS